MRSEPAFQSEDLFRLAAESLPSGVLVVDPDGTILLVNHQIEQQFGYPRHELIGQSVDILLPEGLRSVHAAHRQGFQRTLEARPMGTGRDLRGRRRDGTEFPIEIGLNPMEAEDGVYVLAAVVDITARRELEMAAKLAVEKQLEFERLVAELSFKFINLPPDQIVDAIRDALGRIGETLEVDRCSLYRIPGGESTLVPIGLWHRPGIVPPPVITSFRDRFPWAQETLRAGRLL